MTNLHTCDRNFSLLILLMIVVSFFLHIIFDIYLDIKENDVRTRMVNQVLTAIESSRKEAGHMRQKDFEELKQWMSEHR